jgi:adenylate cyclase
MRDRGRDRLPRVSPALYGRLNPFGELTTKRPGFTEDHIEGLRKVRCRRWPGDREIISESTASNLLDTYVGNRAGGDSAGQSAAAHDTTHAAIWLSDLRAHRAFRPAAGRNRDRYPQPLLDCQWRSSIRTHGGESKFRATGCSRCFDRRICRRYPHLLERAGGRAIPRQCGRNAIPIGDFVERFRFGVALHVGRILYGNIGGGNRLDFTCIGPAVNLAARLEKIAGRLSRTIVASAGFAGICPGGWADLGEFPIAGFSKAERVYGLLDETPSS